MSSEKNHLYWLAAMRLPKIGPLKIRYWLNSLPDIKNLFTASSSELTAAGLSAAEIKIVRQADFSAAERDILWCGKNGCHIVTLADQAYPVLLREIPDAPLVLYVRGSLEQLVQPQIAMVGSRNPTIGGKETAYEFAYYLSKARVIVTSGLALGIDAACHRGALAAGAPTIAVMGTGLHSIYPASHQQLADEIVTCGGALVSEFFPHTPPLAKNFPRRNRVISGMSVGVVVVEAAVRSGSLITARFALEQSREVFAIPGSIHNPRARGCHQLIQQGAKLVETAEHILEELSSLQQLVKKIASHKSSDNTPYLNEKQQHFLQHVGYETTTLDTIILRSGLTASSVSSMLLTLELQGYVHFVPGGCVRTALNSC
jgi:DNA processing protein